MERRAPDACADVDARRGHATLAATSLLHDRTQPAQDHIALGREPTRVRALVLEAQGDRRGAIDALAPIYADVRSHLPILLDEPGAAAWLARTALRDGDRGRVSAVVSAAELLAAENRQFPCIQAIALHTRGLLESEAGALQHAATQHRYWWARASAAEDAAVVLAGSDRDANRVRTRLASRKVRRTRAARPVEGWTV